jgi:hypothetical protein
VLANRTGDQLRAQIAAMTPAERAAPAIVGPDGPLARAQRPLRAPVLTPDPEYWRVRRSPAEVHSITIVFRPPWPAQTGSEGSARDGLQRWGVGGGIQADGRPPVVALAGGSVPSACDRHCALPHWG